MSRRIFSTIIVGALAGLIASPATGQILQLGDLTAKDIEALDKSRTVVVLPGGILEQHGPYLPLLADGYSNSHFAQRIAEAIVSRPGWTAAIAPLIPIGTSGANEIGGKYAFPGTYAVRSSTLRAVFMDLAVAFGEQGFQWIFVVHGHGAPLHNQMLDDAADFFSDTFKGRMIHLTGLMRPAPPEQAASSNSEVERQDGQSPHAGVNETSRLLFLRPDLVRPGYTAATTWTASTWEQRREQAARSDWPGYFGAPKLATADRGAREVRARSDALAQLALDILDGFDPASLPRVGRLGMTNPGNMPINDAALKKEQQVEQLQQQWLGGRKR